jgi:hypothetical protein
MTEVVIRLGGVLAVGLLLFVVAGFVRAMLLDHNTASRAARAGTWPVREGRPSYVPPMIADPTLCEGNWPPAFDERPVVVDVTVSNVPVGEIGGGR